jgi:hypothetical protein
MAADGDEGKGGGGGGSVLQCLTIRIRVEQVLSKFSGDEKNTGVSLRSQTPLSYPSQNKTGQNDVTLIHSSNLREKNARISE